MSTLIRPERTLVPPVTALRSPFASRITGADSPVTADSSTSATPSTISPSPETGSPSSMMIASPFLSDSAGTVSVWPFGRSFFAYASVCARRNVSACALPLPSASASAKLANKTVNQSQMLMWMLNQKGPPERRLLIAITVVITETTSTTNMTGLCQSSLGSSLRKEPLIAALTSVCLPDGYLFLLHGTLLKKSGLLRSTGVRARDRAPARERT